MATSATAHAHAGPQGFIRKYIFSLDHKVIGIQYFLSQPADDALHDHGVLRADYGSAGGIWKLFFADSDWGAGYGVPGPEHAFVLDYVRGICGDHRGVLCAGWGSVAWVDGISAAERGAIGWSG